MFLLCSFFYFLFSTTLKAQQQTSVYVTFNTWVGCSENGNPDRKSFEELIAEGLCLRQCNNSITTFTINTNPASIPTNTIWTIVGGVIQSQGANFCTVQWGTTSQGSITLSTNINGQAISYPALCVDLKINPLSFFTIAPASQPIQSGFYEVCSGIPISFTSLATTNGGTAIDNREWDFGDGTFSSEINPTHLYTQDGTYTVRYRVSNQCSCSSTSTLRVAVGKKGVEITCPSVVCQGEKATYNLPPTFTNSTCSAYNWSVIGGTITSAQPYGPSIDVVWNPPTSADGFGYVTFDPVNCNVDCFKPTTIKIPIIKNSNTASTTQPIIYESELVSSTNNNNPAAIIDICGQEQKKFRLPQWPTTEFNWEVINTVTSNAEIIFNDQRNEILLNPNNSSGNVTLRCRYYNTLLKCGGVASRTIRFKQKAEILGDATACVGAQGSYTTLSGLPATWQFRKSSPAPATAWTSTTASIFEPVFATAGTYQINLSGTNFCSTNNKNVIVNSVTTVPLSVANNSVMSGTQVVGSALVCSGVATTYTLNNTIPNTTLVWQVSNGQFVGTNKGNTVSINFGLQPSPTFTLTVWRETTVAPFCSSVQSSVSLTTLPSVLTIVGPTQTCGSVSQTYSNATLNADSFEWSVVPAAAGSVIGNPNDNSCTILWNEPIIGGQPPRVRLLINKCNGASTVLLPVTIGTPQISISTPITTFCSGTQRVFSIISNPPLTSGTVEWDFGNGNTATGNSVNTVFNTQGEPNTNYTVTATITNPNGCIAVITKSIEVTILQAPVAYVTPAQPLCALNIEEIPIVSRSLSVIIQSGVNGTASIQWYKDGAILTGEESTTYFVTDFGSYHAIVSNNGTCSDQTNSVVFTYCEPPPICEIVPSPNLQLTSTNDCGIVTTTATFNGTPVQMLWDTNITSSTTLVSQATTAGYKQHFFEAKFLDVNNQLCTYSKGLATLVPYLPNIKSAVSCGTANLYNVTLLDDSQFFASTPITSWQFFVNGVLKPQLAGDINTERHITLAPGVYTLKITIARSGFPACSKEITLDLPAFPTAVISMDNGIYCAGESIHFSTPTQAGSSYDWSYTFGGIDIHNFEQNPDFELPAGTINLTLKVTNSVGCATTSAAFTVVVAPNNLSGSLGPDQGGCIGSSASISFVPTEGIPIPVSYQWMNGSTPVPNSNQNPFTTTTPGAYWVIATNAAGCTKRFLNTRKVTVAFIPPPLVTIQGLHSVCLGNEISLTGVVGGTPGTNTLYEWTRSDDPTTIRSDSTTLNDTPPDVGNYTYTLTVKVPAGSGTYCTSTTTHIVSVVATPLVTVSFDYSNFVDCSPYRLKLSAVANMQGTFSWSNGMSGASIIVSNGGAYEVLFTSTSGCTATAQVVAPRSPESYLWIFPTGCYAFCDKIENRALLGPDIVSFDEGWAWNAGINQNSEIGNGAVTTYPIPDVSDSYTLTLLNPLCEFTTKTLTINRLTTCNNCPNFVSYSTVANNGAPATTPFNSYALRFNFSNGLAKVVSITSVGSYGIFQPSTVNVPVGGLANYQVKFIPNSSYTGGNIKLVFTYTNGATTCQQFIEIVLASNVPNRLAEIPTQNEGYLKLIPNPSSSQVQVAYQYDNVMGAKRIELYDLLGRLLLHKELVASTGIWELTHEILPEGQYVVVMRLDEEVVQQQILVKTN